MALVTVGCDVGAGDAVVGNVVGADGAVDDVAALDDIVGDRRVGIGAAQRAAGCAGWGAGSTEVTVGPFRPRRVPRAPGTGRQLTRCDVGPSGDPLFTLLPVTALLARSRFLTCPPTNCAEDTLLFGTVTAA